MLTLVIKFIQDLYYKIYLYLFSIYDSKTLSILIPVSILKTSITFTLIHFDFFSVCFQFISVFFLSSLIFGFMFYIASKLK